MELLTPERLWILLLLALPGFISMKVYDLLMPSTSTTTGQDVLEAMAFGFFNLGLWFVPLYFWVIPAQVNHPILFWIAITAIFTASPVLLAFGTVAGLRQLGSRGWIVHPSPTAWDKFFDTRQPVWVLVRLKSGNMVGGYFGSNSGAGTFPHAHDLYLETA